METRRTIEPDGSPVPGVIPERIRVHHDRVPAHEGRFPADANPPTRARPVADEAVEAVPDNAGQAATAGSQTKEVPK